MRGPHIRLLALLAVVLGVIAMSVACTPQPQGRLGGDGPALPGVAATPPMGWNSWNTFGCNITEQIIKAQADALVSTGMRDAGYTYVVVDDCWAAPTRAADGALQADPVRFPSGMAALAEYVHSRGLRFGLYSGAGDKTCTQFQGVYPGATGSRGHETQDANTFAQWQVDYLKYDWCSADANLSDQVDAFTAMRDALRATGRRIVYSINPNSGVAGSVPGADHDWGGVATMTRVTNDITPAWTTTGGPSGAQGIENIVDAVAPLSQRVRAGAYNDPDMLVVGTSAATPLTVSQQRSQMSMWAMMAAPLIAGNDLTAMTPETLATLTNPTILAIDQDARVNAGARVDDDPEIWVRAVGSKGLAVSMTNRGDHPRSLSVALASLGLTGDATVTGVDAWTGRRYQAAQGRLRVDDVGVDDTVVLRIE